MVFLGYVAAMAYLFIRVSRCADFFGYVLAHMRVPLIFLAIALIGALASGRFINVLLSKMGVKFLSLTFLFLLSSAFSIWPGGSVHQFRNDWPPNITLFVVLTSFLTTARGLKTALSCLGWGSALVAIYALVFGGTSNMGRMDGGGTSYSNPNDLALVMVIGSPALMFMAADSTRSMLQRAAAGLLLVPMAIVLLATGSRGGLLGFVMMSAFLLWFQSWGVRIRVATAVVLMGVIGVAAAPQAGMERLTTFMDSAKAIDPISDANFGPRDENKGYEEVAAASARGRWHLSKQALELMVTHPVLGVGFSMFMVAENDLATKEGSARGSWKGTHNMYLQVGSENGLIALYLFLSIIFACWKSYRFHRRPGANLTATEQQLRLLAFGFSASMVGYMVSGTFLTIAYDYFLPMYAAVAIGFDNVAELEAQRRRASEADLGPTSVVEGVPGHIDWTQGPVGAPVPAHLRQGA